MFVRVELVFHGEQTATFGQIVQNCIINFIYMN